jgi:hypothetical protein
MKCATIISILLLEWLVICSFVTLYYIVLFLCIFKYKGHLGLLSKRAIVYKNFDIYKCNYETKIIKISPTKLESELAEVNEGARGLLDISATFPGGRAAPWLAVLVVREGVWRQRPLRGLAAATLRAPGQGRGRPLPVRGVLMLASAQYFPFLG